MKTHAATIATLACLILCQCNKKDSSTDTSYMSGETQRITLEQKLRLLELRWASRAPEVDKANSIIELAEETELTAKHMRKARTDLAAQVALLEKDLSRVQKETIAKLRRDAVGRKLESFVTKSRTFNDVTIKSVNDTGIEISHNSGSSRITPMQMDAAQCAEFGLQVSTALAALNQEARNQQQFTAQVDKDLAVVRRNEQVREEAAEAARRASERTAAIVASIRSSSTLAATPQTKVYRVRSRYSGGYYDNSYYYKGNSCGSSYYPSQTRVTPVSPRVTPTPCPPILPGQ